jgi:hypothetical protein
MKEKKDDSIMIRFTKKKKWLKEVINDEAKYLDESRNYIILEALTEKFKDKEPEKKVRR